MGGAADTQWIGGLECASRLQEARLPEISGSHAVSAGHVQETENGGGSAGIHTRHLVATEVTLTHIAYLTPSVGISHLTQTLAGKQLVGKP